MPPRALILDFDGVIADTENVHIAAWQRTFASLGWEMSDDLCARSMEIDDRVFLAEIFAAKRIEDGDIEGWVRKKQELTISMLTHTPRLVPGMAALIREAGSRVVLAVVSSTWRANIETVLAVSGLAERFSVIVGKEDVEKPKPDPEGYRLALSRLKLRPSDAVVLEDSGSGLAAAQGAGIAAVAFCQLRGPGEWTGAAPRLMNLTPTADALRILGLI